MADGRRVHVPADRPARLRRIGRRGFEPGDVAVWARWVRERTHGSEVFGYGQSRGGTTLIQSLTLRPGLDAIAAECAGPGEIGRSYWFVAERIGVSERTAKMVAWPLIEPSFWWIRQRFGIDLKSVRSGLAAMRATRCQCCCCRERRIE